MPGTVHVLCADGSVIEHSLPLPEGIADRIARDELRLVEQATPKTRAGKASPQSAGE